MLRPKRYFLISWTKWWTLVGNSILAVTPSLVNPNCFSRFHHHQDFLVLLIYRKADIEKTLSLLPDDQLRRMCWLPRWYCHLVPFRFPLKHRFMCDCQFSFSRNDITLNKNTTVWLDLKYNNRGLKKDKRKWLHKVLLKLIDFTYVLFIWRFTSDLRL